MRLTDFLIADDVRHEIGGKFSIMGVYGDGIKINSAQAKWPIPFRIALFLRASLDECEKIPDSFSLAISMGENKIAEMNGTISLKSKEAIGQLVLPLLIFPLPLPGPGLISFVLKIMAGEEVLLDESRTIDFSVDEVK
ncbi:MAG: hypothetical protein RBQ88_12735 [Desulfobulbus oligotrophicus]|nr:hypothetical protein [Desulfobulbus oligotrophicus]